MSLINNNTTNSANNVLNTLETATSITEQPSSKGFTDFTHRLSEKDKVELKASLETSLKTIEKEPDLADNYVTIVKKVYINDWTKPDHAALFKLDNFDHYLLIALNIGDISLEQLTTCQLAKSALIEASDPNAKVIDLFLENGEINKEAYRYVQKNNECSNTSISRINKLRKIHCFRGTDRSFFLK